MRKLATAAFSFSAAIYSAHLILPRVALLPIAIVLLAAAPGALLLRGVARTRVLLIAVPLAAGLFWQLGFDAIYRAPANLLAGSTETVEAVALGYPARSGYGERVRISVRRPGADPVALLYLSGTDSGITPGDVIELTARFEPSDSVLGEETYVFTARGEFMRAYQSGGFTVTGRENSLLYLPQRIAREVSDMAYALFGDAHGPFMRALLVGDTAELYDDTGLMGALSVTGAMHVVSVSGMHLAFLMGFLGLVIRRKRLLAALAVPMIVLFMAMTGFSPPIVRAGIMQLFLLSAPLVNRESDGVTSLSAALFVLLALNPYACMSIGLQLSFAATLGMVLFTNRIDEAIDTRLRERRLYDKKPVRLALRFVTSSFASTAGATVFTVPLTALHFGMVSMLAPVTNLVTLWAVSAAFCLGLLACATAFIVPPVGELLARVAAVPIEYIIRAVKTLARVPYAAVYVSNTLILFWLAYVYTLGITLATLRARLRQLIYPVCSCAVTFFIILIITPSVSATYNVSIASLDVGQGQCVVLTSGEYTAMVDCGSSSGANAGAVAHEYLTARGETAIDLLILTHFHTDHANGVEYLLTMMNVASLAIPDPDIAESYLAEDIIELARRRGTDIIYITETMSATLGDAEFTLYPPLGDEDENERGLAILVSGGGLTALVTGDMDARGERRLLRYAELPDIDVLVAGHHGSRYSTSEELLAATTPEVALISVGRNNNYGHPAPDTLERLAEYGVSVYRTDLCGSITVGGHTTEETDGEG